MANREPGQFRKKIFGGFNRRDVLEHIKTLYTEIEQADSEKQTLRDRCEELENLLQNLEKFSGRGGHVLRVAPGSKPQAASATVVEPAVSVAMPESLPEPIIELEAMPELDAEPASLSTEDVEVERVPDVPAPATAPDPAVPQVPPKSKVKPGAAVPRVPSSGAVRVRVHKK